MYRDTETPYTAPDHYLSTIDDVIFDLLDPQNRLDILQSRNIMPTERFDIASQKYLDDDRFYWTGVLLSGSTDECIKLPTLESLLDFLATHRSE